MFYSELSKSLQGSNILESIRSYGNTIQLNADGVVLVNGKETDYKTIEEARTHIKQEYVAHKLEEQVSKELYEELSHNTVANIIKEYHDVKVTDTLIETYIQLASSNMFSVDPIVQKIRSLNKLDKIVEGKLHYMLADDTIVTISERTQDRLNNLLQNKLEIIEYMRESKENFLHVLEKIEE